MEPADKWWQSPKISMIIVTVVLLIGFKLYSNHQIEQKRIELAFQAEETKRQALVLAAKKAEKEREFNNESAAIENQGEAIELSSQLADNRQTLSSEIQTSNNELEKARLENEIKQSNAERELKEKKAAGVKEYQEKHAAEIKSQEIVESDRQRLFNRLVAEHRYREAADFAKTPDEIARLDRLVKEASNAPVDKSKSLECEQAKRQYDMAAFRKDEPKQVKAKRELWGSACGIQLPAEVEVTISNSNGGGSLPRSNQVGVNIIPSQSVAK